MSNVVMVAYFIGVRFLPGLVAAIISSAIVGIFWGFMITRCAFGVNS